MQRPASATTAVSDAALSALNLQDLEGLGKLLQVLDREVQTLDVSKQEPGPRWSLRQWCQYWCDRKTGAEQQLGDAGAGGTALAGLTGLLQQAASEAAAARGMSSSSSHGRGAGGDMDDEADSAWVHGKG